MTKRLILGILLALLLLLPSQLLAGERPSPGPTIAKPSAVPSDCGCFKKYGTATSPALKLGIPVYKPHRAPIYRDCYWDCDYHCYLWVGPECVEWVYDCIYVCDGLPARPPSQ